MRQMRARRLVLAIVVPGVMMGAMVGGVLGASPAQAEPDRITEGDVQAVFEAGGAGGQAILQHSRVVTGSPEDLYTSHGAIIPFSQSPWDGAHFCAADWHVILLSDFEGGDSSFAYTDAERIMQGLSYSFTLDGAALPTNRTAIKRYLNPEEFGFQVAYYFQQGRIMAPTDLSINSHRLEVTLTSAAGQILFQDGITFSMDAPGTGACI